MSKKRGLSRYRREKIMRAFAADLTATQTALLLGFNRNTVNRYFTRFRSRIAEHQRAEAAPFRGTVELDESYFGPARPRGQPSPRRRGRGTDKQAVFGIMERGGRVFTELIPDVKANTLQSLVKGQVSPGSVIMTDAYRAYDGLVHLGYDKHYRINKYGKEREGFARGPVHINGIESFWSFTKRRLAKFNGVSKNLELHLKECEWRWGKNPDTLLRELKTLLV